MKGDGSQFSAKNGWVFIFIWILLKLDGFSFDFPWCTPSDASGFGETAGRFGRWHPEVATPDRLGALETMMICWSKPNIFQQQYLVYLWFTMVYLDFIGCYAVLQIWDVSSESLLDILHAKLGHLKFKNPRIAKLEYLCDAFEILWNRAWKLGNLWVQTTSFPRYSRRTQAFVGKTCGFSARLNNYKTR